MLDELSVDTASSGLAEALRRDPDLQRRMCDPTFNPNAASFFIFNYCLTQDEDRSGLVGPLPDPYGRGASGLKLIEAFDAPRLNPHNIHDESLDACCTRGSHAITTCGRFSG